jgi:quinol monooxygenase YgiN
MSATLAARHSVADYAIWRKAYDDAEPIRARHGCTGHRVLRLPEDHNDLFITHEFASIEGAKAFAADPEFAAAMQQAGVTSAPRIEIFESL